MIFVVLGTWEMPFVRPLQEIDRAIEQGLLREPVIVQCGKTAYRSPQMELVPFFGHDELAAHYEAASLVICQAGVGSIMLGLKKEKKVICIARRQKFDEHIDDHQLEILHVFATTGAVLAWNGEGDLPQVLERTQTFVSQGYRFTDEKISTAILEDLTAHRRRGA